MEFSILENVFYPKIIHLYASIFQVFALNNYLCASWLKYFFFTWKCPLSKENMPLCECFLIFLLKIIYLCASWLKWHFYTEKYFPPEYTSSSYLVGPFKCFQDTYLVHKICPTSHKTFQLDKYNFFW